MFLPRLICCAILLTSSGSVSIAQKLNGWTDYKEISGTKWAYTERYDSGKLVQCKVVTEAKLGNGTSAGISISIPSKGSAVIAIDDSDLKNRINKDIGWKEGSAYAAVLLNGNYRVEGYGQIVSDTEFAVKPEDENIFRYESFVIAVGGLSMKAFIAPHMPLAWEALSRCKLRGH